MSNEEIKALMLELAEQIGNVKETIRKINQNSVDEINKNCNWDAPRVYGLRIDCERYKDSVVSNVHCRDVLKVMGMPETVIDKEGAYPYELSVECDGVRFFELRETLEVEG